MKDRPVILYVDDEETNLLLFRMAFENGREVLLANSPNEGLIKLTENRERITAVISDMHMPKMNGVQFVNEARKELNTIPYFILSGYFYDDEIDLALKEKKILKFFTKPFDKAEIEGYLNETNS
ncbi:MAG: response regulator [Ekhidna sp.]|nr:response regulator [Ekhidna sp.]MBC6410892.1 response regulator [Ekhidna sp.]MBC6426556.1 response regulator [Ekhidna sp.]